MNIDNVNNENRLEVITGTASTHQHRTSSFTPPPPRYFWCLTRSVEFLFGESAVNIDQVRGTHLLVFELGHGKEWNNSSDSATNS